MKVPRPALLVLFALLPITVMPAQEAAPQQSTAPATVQKDPQALSIINQSLTAVGGATSVAAIQDYTATGAVNYYWGDGEQGSVTVKGRGTGDFRVDAILPEGNRTWSVSNGTGFITEADGSTTVTSLQNSLNLGSLAFPYEYLLNATQDTATSASFIATETINGAQVLHIQTQTVSPATDPAGLFQHLSTRDFYFDPTTHLLVAMKDMLHPNDNATVDFPHEVDFSNYQTINGAQFPLSIAESVRGQPTETLQLTSITFNSGLQDSDFQQQ